MATINVPLKHGLKVGNETQKVAVLTDQLTAGQILDAKEAAEKVVAFAVNGRTVPVVVESPARFGALLLCEQIRSIGKITGPLDSDQLNMLHHEDLDILNAHADLLAGAISTKELADKLTEKGLTASPEVTQRGRSDSDSDRAAAHGNDADQKGNDDH
ncbi:MAG: hypothetical protein CMI04_08815 [Oceanospirillaceae bacterium]|nr:hypothetical protein [Oceanospirillaceae bacterium]|tara:strand:+ start:1978 stop:2451 length:474 start_codon:yes stop_codon:yes gene_type:complete